MAYTRRTRTRRSVPWAGWSKESPKGKQRTRMLRDCGSRCFLGPRKSFPICTKGTCRVNPKGVYAAYIRAREWGKKPSSYKGKARPTMEQWRYKKIASTAKRMLSRRGFKVGKSSRTRRNYRGGMKRCPKGYSRKIRGQKRAWRHGVDRIVRHGKLSRKCYKNRK